MATLAELLPPAAIRVGDHAADWRQAVRAAGAVLADTGATDPAYTGEMLAVVEELGPYIVLAPGIALGHARPSPAVHRVGFSWVGLADPVSFGHPQNDPVSLVLGMAAPDDGAHTAALTTIARLLGDGERRAALLAARTPAAVHAMVVAYEGESAT